MEHGSESKTRTGKSPLRRLDDQLRFLLSLVGNPKKIGAVAPSGKALAAEMAAQIDPALSGPVIELGPGTGPVTQALIESGIAPERIITVEYDIDFAERLQKRFPGIHVICGDAYDLSTSLNGIVDEKACAIISSLPLFNQPVEKRTALLNAAFDILCARGPFVQFTYAPVSPIPRETADIETTVSDWIFKNVPPARVWTYRRAL
ncbi:MAG: rRNA adenine N-6-methyltransferase family protein [Pseudomonadota bacterium]